MSAGETVGERCGARVVSVFVLWRGAFGNRIVAAQSEGNASTMPPADRASILVPPSIVEAWRGGIVCIDPL